MKITYLDMIDWEPLKMKFIPKRRSQPDTNAASAFIQSYFKECAEEDLDPDCPIREWDVRVGPSGSIIALCEFISEDRIHDLANSLVARFPQYVKVELGERAKGLPQSKSIIWVNFDETTEASDGSTVSIGPFAISRFHITIEQYVDFLGDTKYVPFMYRHGKVRDIITSFMGCQIAEGGKSQMRWPVTHITLEDAESYCRWLGVRLPTAAELTVFCKWVVNEKVQMQFTSDCWTSTQTDDGQSVVLMMPWRSKHIERGWKVTAYSPDRWEHPFISFRVCRERIFP